MTTKKSKTYRKIAKLDMYNCVANFIITTDLTKDVAKLYKKNGIKLDFDVIAEGLVFSHEISDYYLIIDNYYLSHNTIAHEIYHLVTRITEDRGIIDEESQAWLAGHLSQIVYDYIKKNNLVVKNG